MTIRLRIFMPLAWLLALSFVLQPVASAVSDTRTSPIEPPEMTAQAAYVVDATTGIPLYSKNPDERRAIGSVVKIMTALVTLKHVSDPDNTHVTITDYDPVEIQYSKMNVQVGDTLTVTQLLYGLMLPSGGDAANALCRHVGAIISGINDPNIACESFVMEMNAVAAEIGLSDSRFTNPDGRDDDYSYSSAHDVYLMTDAMYRNPKLMSIISNPAYRFDSVGNPPKEYAADSTLAPHMTNGIIGGKTGSESNAGGNVALIRDVNGGSNKVIIVVMGSTLVWDDAAQNYSQDTRWDDVNKLIAAMDSQFTWTNPSEAGVIPGLSEQLMVWDVTFKDPPAIPVPTNAAVPIAFQMQVGPVVATGEPAGTLYLFYGDTPVGELPLYQAEIGWQNRRAA